MNHLFLSFIMFVFLFLTGCVGLPDNFHFDTDPVVPVKKINFPTIGIETRGNLGKTLVAYGIKSEIPAIELKETWNYKGGRNSVPPYYMKSGVGKLIQQITDFDTGKIWNCFEFDFYREDNWNYNSAITNAPMSGKVQLCKDEFDNFIFRFKFKLEPGANNGIGIRTPLIGDAAFEGMEVQVLENSDPKYAGLKNWQFHGSLYGLAPALRGYQRPAGEWNDQEIRAEGQRITVILNGKVINEVDLDEVIRAKPLSGQPHPGATRKSGHIAFCGHGDRVAYKDLRIHPLPVQKKDN